MNLKDQYLTAGLGLIGIGTVGVFFPAFAQFLFWITGIAGIISICWWTWKETKGEKQ